MYNYVKNNLNKGMTYMKPRIFVSSTFYDLKYIREDLANFVRSYGYEPILFEDGDIGYTPGKTLDKSCYESMRNSDMVILVIGGEYGSAASGEEKDTFKEYISVTRNEFRSALEAGIPIFVMIDKKVMAEYGVYDANYDSIEKENKTMNFPTTKNINVFRFIKEIKGIVTLPIQEFDKSSDIKDYISKQWADMFKNYLNSLRDVKESKKIENSVYEMKILIQKMNVMLDSVGKNVLTKDNPQEYENVINQQDIIDFCNIVSEAFDMKVNYLYLEDEDVNIRKELISDFLKILKETHEKNLWIDFDSEEPERVKKFFELFDQHNFVIESIDVLYTQKISDKIYLLNNESSFQKIVNLLATEKYFYRLNCI